jgi:hypothetical protein
MGKNKANLFKGVKTLKGYQSRFEKKASIECQSNGSLMRASSISFFEQVLCGLFKIH